VSTGSAVYTGPIPVGQLNPAAQYVDVVAMYGGDAKHMASVSSKVRLTFAPVTFCVVPAYGAVQPNQSIQYTAMGGTPPVKWYTAGDTTCDNMGNCSYLNETTGAFQAGPEPGYVVVVGIDSNGIEQESDVTVGDPTTIVDAGPPPWGDAGVILGGCATSIDGGGPPLDGGQDSGSGPVDSGAPATDSGSPSDASTGSDTGVTPVTEAGTDSGTEDGGMANTTAKAGCGCKIAGTQQSGSLGAIAGLALGLGALVRRRRR